MELSDVVLALVSIISTGLIAVMKSTNKTIKDIEDRVTKQTGNNSHYKKSDNK